MPANDCTVPLKRRRTLRVRTLHVCILVGIAAAVALVDAPPVPVETLAAVGADTPRHGGDAVPVDYLPARLPAPRGPGGPWIDTF